MLPTEAARLASLAVGETLTLPAVFFEQGQARLLPDTRAALLQLFGGEDNADFCEYLNENCYDLHYASAAQAQPFSFGVGNLWRIAVDWPGSPVPPCLHRAPETRPGQPPRLLLIS